MTRVTPKTVWTATLAALLAAALAASVPAIAAAGDNQTAPGAAAAAPPSPPPAANRPGFLHELASWWDGSIAYFSAKLKDARGKVEDLGKTSNEAAKGAATATQQAMKNAVDVSKDAASAVVRLPNTRLIEMRERCDKAPNGAPDCAAAAANGCRAKGFTGGTSLDVTTAENCPAPTLLSRQEPAKGECPVETVVTRAVCQ
ncbi:MAG: hypothetical protein ABSA90_12805 [Xanthobacteraceae bacterium]